MTSMITLLLTDTPILLTATENFAVCFPSGTEMLIPSNTHKVEFPPDIITRLNHKEADLNTVKVT
jgi:hypothetical protein